MIRSGSPLPAAVRRIGWSNLFAQLSEQIGLAAAPLAAVLVLSARPSETAWLQMAQTLPFLLLSIPAGLIVDRASRRLLMIGAEALRAASLAVIAALLACGGLDLPLLAALGFAGAVGTVCYSVATPALLPALTPRNQLAMANRWLELARSAASMAGPALGGLLVSWLGASAAHVLATVLSLLAIRLLSGLPRERRGPAPPRSLIHDLAEGSQFIFRHDLLRPILITAVFFNTGWFILQAIYVAYAVQNLGLSAAEVGLTLAVHGAGMIAAALIAPALSDRISFGTMIIIGPVSGFCAAVLMLLTAWTPSLWLACVGFFLFGAGPTLWAIATMTLRQAVTPQAMLGRVSAFIMTATFGARPLGAAIGATVAARSGVTACLLAATVCFGLQLTVIGLSRVPKLQQLPKPV